MSYNTLTEELNKKPSVLQKAKISKWTDEIRKIIYIDKIPIAQLREVYNFLKNQKVKKNNFAWRYVILSPANLREKYDKILISMSLENKKTKVKVNSLPDSDY
jgi:hypothetical protein